MTTHKTMMVDEKTDYVLLPVRGMHSEAMSTLGLASTSFGRTLRARLKASKNATLEITPKGVDIVHSVSPTGAKLVAVTPQELAALRVEAPGVRAVPVVVYDLMRSPRLKAVKRAKSTKTGPGISLRLKVEDGAGNPVQGALVVAFTDFAAGVGGDSTSNAKGEATLKLQDGPMVEVLAVYADITGHWGLVQRHITLVDGYTVKLDAVDLSQDDFVTRLYGKPKATDGRNVVVGVVDTGVDGTHPDLTVQQSRAFVYQEKDAGDGSPRARDGEHGTHVAGLVSGRGQGAARHHAGRAPAATLNSYRVFPQAGGGALNYDILRAIEAAVEDGCDLINLSLGTPSPDEAVRDAIKEAFDRGTVCIAAAGNNGRKPLLFPARWSEVISITAIGEKGTYPDHSTETLDELDPYTALTADSLHKRRYAAKFTNIGPEVIATAPGVGIVSTLPGTGYGAMSGTSMAAPVACGLLVAELSRNPQILTMARTRQRAIAIQRLFFSMCVVAGFARDFEGQGLPK
ncbi:S8 family serine peptidase [Delftia acidovorans]